MNKIIPVLLLLLTGCGGNVEVPIPPTAGDFVDNQNGTGTARVFGIDFQVSVEGKGVRSEGTIHANLVEADKSEATKSFTMGDDVSVQLESIDESEVRFVFNDQNYGTLQVGDKVVIDDQRAVQVNGTPRTPATAEQ